eukprot:TRINITY_DN5117_c0_g1_i1.p1 TRINITY_DN5117_c0_g1~~TRINITY_DN5117_c0_g1_i1.p1  ORF type:complete len:543 (-),score=71.13 TRINITY_DN5117_c0_g1_i1:380-1903(-)
MSTEAEVSVVQFEQEDEIVDTEPTVEIQTTLPQLEIGSETVEVSLDDKEEEEEEQQVAPTLDIKSGVSLLVAAYQSEELEQTPGGVSKSVYDSPDLVVAVLNPEKRAGRNRMGVSSNYMTYEVHTLTTLPEYGFAERSVRRRFSDFVTLHGVLRQQFPGCFIPALPEKNYIEGRRMGEEFIKIRTADLNKFVRQLAAHPEIRRSNEFVKFLSIESELAHSFEWAHLVSTASQTQQQMDTGGKGLVDFMKMVREYGAATLGSKQGIEQSEVESKWKQIRQELGEREKVYNSASKGAESLIKALDDLGTEMSEFGASCVRFARFEEEAGEQHGQYTLTGRYSTKRAADFQRIGYGTLKMSPMFKKQALFTASKLITIHDELAFLPEVFQGLQEREATYSALQSLKHDIHIRESKGAAANAVSVKAIQQQKDLEALKQQAEIGEMQYQRLLDRNEQEMRRYDQIGEQERLDMLLGYIELQMQFNQQLEKAWNAVAQQFQDNTKLTGHDSP